MITLTFEPFRYQRVSDPQLSLNHSIVIRVLTLENEHQQVVVYDNSIRRLPKEKVELMLAQFKDQLALYFD